MKLLIIGIFLGIVLFLGFSRIEAESNPYQVYYYYSGSETYLIAISDKGGVGICKR